MTLSQLKYVVEVSKAGSINKAAANLFLSQSVLSTAILNLEKEIGHVIFMRSNRGVTLTPFGHTFTSYISAIQSQLDQVESLIHQGPHQHTFSLSVASTGFFFLSSIFSKIYEEYRSMGIRIEHYEGHENNVADMVASQIYEMGLIRLWNCYKNSYIKQLRSKRLQYFAIAQLNIAITVGPRNPLYFSENDFVTNKELAQFPSVINSDIDSGPYSDIFQRLKLSSPRSRFITTSRASIYEMLEDTDCYYLNSTYPFEKVDSGHHSPYDQFRTLKLADSSIFSEIAWIKREDSTLSPMGVELLNRIMHYFNASVNPVGIP